jgi:hypothetical protein
VQLTPGLNGITMAPKEFTKHQHDIIRNYYENRDTIALQKLGELVTELYLAETETKRAKLWERVEKSMTQLKTPAAIAAHIMQKKDIEILARNLQEWLGKAPNK